MYGENAIAFWCDDNGVIRGYYYASDIDELKELLKYLPKGTVIDVITRGDLNTSAFLGLSGFCFLHELQRFSSVGLSSEESKYISERIKFMADMYKVENVCVATENDVDVLNDKLYEIFDKRESHLPTRDELVEYIQRRWVCLYYENKELKGFYIFKVMSNGQFYGYEIWNGTGPDGYFSMVMKANELHAEYCNSNKIPLDKIPPSYCWVNVKNKKAMRPIKFWGMKFDGLRDFVYEKQ